MTAQPDFERLIESFFEDGPRVLPGSSYDAVRAAVDRTRQRFVLGPWREEQIMNAARFALGAAAIVLVAVLGIRFLPGVIEGPGGTPSPTPSPTASASALGLPISGPLDPGTYFRYEGDGADPRIRYTFTMPSGWTVEEGSFLYKDKDEPGEVMFTTWIVSHVYTDACHWNDTSLVDVRSSSEALIDALADQGGRQESPGVQPSEGDVSGFPSRGISLEVPEDLDTDECTSGVLRYWPAAGPDFTGGFCCNAPGNTDRIYAVDVNGRILTIVARDYAASTEQDLAELQSILDSVQIEP